MCLAGQQAETRTMEGTLCIIVYKLDALMCIIILSVCIYSVILEEFLRIVDGSKHKLREPLSGWFHSCRVRGLCITFYILDDDDAV